MPKSAGVGDVALDGGGLEERLGRDAATVQAGAAEGVLLDEGHAEAGAAGVERRAVAAGAAADDHEIELLTHARNGIAVHVLPGTCERPRAGGSAHQTSIQRTPSSPRS